MACHIQYDLQIVVSTAVGDSIPEPTKDTRKRHDVYPNVYYIAFFSIVDWQYFNEITEIKRNVNT